jgi:hypothetical protein
LPAELHKFAGAFHEISVKAQSLGFDSLAHACENNAARFAVGGIKEVVALYEELKTQVRRPSSTPTTIAMIEAFDAHIRMLNEVLLLAADAGRCKVVASDPNRCLSVQKMLAPMTGFDYAHMMSGMMYPGMNPNDAKSALRAFEAASPLEDLRKQEPGFTASKAAVMAAGLSATEANELGRAAWVKGR